MPDLNKNPILIPGPSPVLLRPSPRWYFLRRSPIINRIRNAKRLQPYSESQFISRAPKAPNSFSSHSSISHRFLICPFLSIQPVCPRGLPQAIHSLVDRHMGGEANREAPGEPQPPLKRRALGLSIASFDIRFSTFPFTNYSCEDGDAPGLSLILVSDHTTILQLPSEYFLA